MPSHLFAAVVTTLVVELIAAREASAGGNHESGSSAVRHFANSVAVEFPLRGEWLAPNTPGARVPSHGTDFLAETYAFDFLQVDWRRPGSPFYRTSLLTYLLAGVSLDMCYCWGQEVFSPCDGTIVTARDGWPERQRVHLASDISYAARNSSFRPEADDLRKVAGNYIIMRCSGNVYAAFAHLQMGSIIVAEGQKVRKGTLLARVGHSGNSTAPHLHFQMMDSADVLTAKGVPCVFERYEVFREDEWKPVYLGVPSNKDRIRF